MKHFLCLAVIASFLLSFSEAIFTGGIAITAAGLGLLGLKAAAGIGFAKGAYLGSRRSGGYSRRRYGRSTTDLVLQASVDDETDCAKKLVCMLNTVPEDKLAADELAIRSLFGLKDEIDVSSSTVEFDLAALVGRKAGAAQCQTLYSRCQYKEGSLMDIIRSNEI